MKPESKAAMAAMALMLLATGQDARAQHLPRDLATLSGKSDPGDAGIRTDRLNKHHLQDLKSIQTIVMAVDPMGQPIRPRLYSLWHWAQFDGHEITLEFMERRDPALVVGAIWIETRRTAGSRKTAVIRLNLRNIREAIDQDEAPRADGLIPFKGLTKYERYAEVLGHELAHAYLIFEDPQYALLFEELTSETAAYPAARRRLGPANFYKFEMKPRMVRLKALTDRFERPVESVETQIWHELTQMPRPVAVPQSAHVSPMPTIASRKKN